MLGLAWSLFIVLSIGWVMSKLEGFSMYQVRRAKMLAEVDQIQAIACAARARANYWRARSWELIQGAKKGAEFTESEIAALRAMGLEDFLEENGNDGDV